MGTMAGSTPSNPDVKEEAGTLHQLRVSKPERKPPPVHKTPNTRQFFYGLEQKMKECISRSWKCDKAPSLSKKTISSHIFGSNYTGLREERHWPVSLVSTAGRESACRTVKSLQTDRETVPGGRKALFETVPQRKILLYQEHLEVSGLAWKPLKEILWHLVTTLLEKRQHGTQSRDW